MPNTIPNEYRSVIKDIIGSDAQIFTATAGKIYLTKPDLKKWSDVNLYGPIVFLRDKTRNSSLFLRLVDLSKKMVTWEHEIYFELKYTQELPYFYTFASDDHVVGICFADSDEATQFNQIISKKREIYQNPESLSLDKKNNKQLGSQDSNKKGKLTRAQISSPSDFKHVSHIGFEKGKGFDTINIPPEWEAILNKAGITASHLQDQGTAQFIQQFIQENTLSGQQSTSASNGGDDASLNYSSRVKSPPPPPPPRGPKSSNSRKSNGPQISASVSQDQNNTDAIADITIKSAVVPGSQNDLSIDNNSGIPPPPPPPPSATASTKPSLISAAGLNESKSNLKPPSMTIPPPMEKSMDSRDNLLSSIRNAGQGMLKPVEKRANQPSSSHLSKDSAINGAPEETDIMAGLLAKALAERNRKISRSPTGDGSADDDEGNDEW